MQRGDVESKQPNQIPRTVDAPAPSHMELIHTCFSQHPGSELGFFPVDVPKGKRGAFAGGISPLVMNTEFIALALGNHEDLPETVLPDRGLRRHGDAEQVEIASRPTFLVEEMNRKTGRAARVGTPARAEGMIDLKFRKHRKGFRDQGTGQEKGEHSHQENEGYLTFPPFYF